MSDVIPTNNAEYGTKKYWEERYAKENPQNVTYDWFIPYSLVKDVIESLIAELGSGFDSRVLHLGIGNSPFSEDMYDSSGYKNQVNVDFSQAVIDFMSARNQDQRPEMQWVVADILKGIPEPDASFDLVVDKGTLDAVTSGGADMDVWESDVEDETRQVVSKYLSECNRLLKPGGYFVFITFGQPHFRRPFLQKVDGWKLEPTQSVGEDMLERFIYICRKEPF